MGRAVRVEGAPAPEADLTRTLYEQYGNQIFRYCLHQLGSREEAEDAVQSTFLNAFRCIKRGVVPELESAWLFKIAHNVCLSRRRTTWRRGRIESPTDFDVVEEMTPAPSRRADELMGVQDVLEQMPENQRRAILLREWQGLSYREIAEELELSQAAVETLIFRARRSLAAGLEQPPERKKRKLVRGADLGNVLAAIKSLVVGGGAAAKVAATVAVVSASTVVAAAPVQQHRAKAHHPSAPVPSTVSAAQPAPRRAAADAGPAPSSPTAGARRGPKEPGHRLRGHSGAVGFSTSETASQPAESAVVAAPEPAQAPVGPAPNEASASALPAQADPTPAAEPQHPSPGPTPAPASGEKSKTEGGSSRPSSRNGDSHGDRDGKSRDARQGSTTTAVVPPVTVLSPVPASGNTSSKGNSDSKGSDSKDGDSRKSSAAAVTTPDVTRAKVLAAFRRQPVSVSTTTAVGTTSTTMPTATTATPTPIWGKSGNARHGSDSKRTSVPATPTNPEANTPATPTTAAAVVSPPATVTLPVPSIQAATEGKVKDRGKQKDGSE